MRYTPFLLLIILLSVLSCSKEPPTEIAFYYMETCPGCESYKAAETMSSITIAIGQTRNYEGRGWNLAYGAKGEFDSLMEDIEERGLPDISYSLPLLFVGEEYYVGYDEIKAVLDGLYDECCR